MRNPPPSRSFHPNGDYRAYGLVGTVAAIALQVSRPALSDLLNGKADLSGDMALRIEKPFGVTMDTVLRMQASYGTTQTRKQKKEIRVRRFAQLADIQP